MNKVHTEPGTAPSDAAALAMFQQLMKLLEQSNAQNVVDTHTVDEENQQVAEHDDTALQNAKSLKEVLDLCGSFAGLFAGFEGFIINEYVDGKELPVNIKVGLFLLVISFCLNVCTSTLAIVTGICLRSGLYRKWFRYLIGRVVMLFTLFGVLLFCVAFLLYIFSTGLDKALVYIIYGTCGLLMAGTLIFFLTVLCMMSAEDKASSDKVLTTINA
uniref:Transmembrane protein n=1 Tax=Eutreptiella gymnastica TaxID=73025 RepID=A0A7S4LLK5_9EUGL